MQDRTPFLATPKGVFVMGFAVGALCVLSAAFGIATISPPPFGHPLLNQEGATKAELLRPSDKLPATARAVDKNDHVRGAGKITVIEYADFECPYCQEFHETMQQVMAMSSVQVRWVFRHFPLTSIHPDAMAAAEASECAADQGKFWPMADAMYAHQKDGLSAAQLAAYAKAAGVNDMGAWSDCMAKHVHADRIQADAAEAQALGADGTPYSVVVNEQGNSQDIPGALPISNVKAIIDALGK